MIKPLYEKIIFRFLNDTESNRGMFEEETESGFKIIANHDDTAKKARWAKVSFIGPDVKDVKVNDYIFIEPLMWTDSFKYKYINYWSTDESKVLLISEDKPKIGY